MKTSELCSKLQRALFLDELPTDPTACLDALILTRRGPRPESATPQEAVPERLDNNVVLKKLRIAFQLQESGMTDIFSKGGVQLEKYELSSMARKKGHKHYKACPDELLEAFLEGLFLSPTL